MPTTQVGEVDRQKAVEAVVRSAAGLDDTQLTEAFELMLGSRGQVGFSRDHVLTALRALLRADQAVDTATALAVPLQEAVVNNRFYLRMIEVESLARAAVLAHKHYNATEVGQLLNGPDTNLRSRASQLRKSGDIVGVPTGAQAWVYPAFQFDHRGARVRPIVKEVNQQLDAAHDGWGVSSWWLTPSDRFKGEPKSPADLAMEGDDATIRRLAADLLED